MNILIGNTGLVGTTLQEHIHFDYMFNSKNINTFNSYTYTDPVLYLACLPATKWLVNKNIKSDIDNIISIINIISKIKYSKIVLISTIDVYCDSPLGVDENYPINFKNLSYGTNRYLFEQLVTQTLDYDDLKIFRLPALFNKHIKKNILFDLIHNNNIDQININSTFQWYNLDNLYSDIIKYTRHSPSQTVFNLFTEPIPTSKIVELFPEASKLVDKSKSPIEYDYTTKHSSKYLPYISTQQEVLNDIKQFIHDTKNF